MLEAPESANAAQILLRRLEQQRGSRALLFAAVQLDLDLLTPLYESLCEMPTDRPLDVVFYCRGGVVNAARRIALMLREFFPQVRFLVPHYCESAGTITVLSGDEVLAGPVAVFSPIDPLLHSDGGDSGPAAMSVQDLRLFSRMSQDWFGLTDEEARQHALSTLCDSIFPSTLTSFHRVTLELEEICETLLSYPMPADSEQRKRVAQQLIYGYHSHSYALTGDELAALGLPVRRADAELAQLIWALGGELRQHLGAGAREREDGPWYDALFLSTAGGRVQQRFATGAPGGRQGRWLRWAALADESADSAAESEGPDV